MKKQIIIPPEGGWESQTSYVVEIAMTNNNPIHQDIFYSGFLNGGQPAGYNILFSGQVEIEYVKYLKVIRKIDTSIDNKYKMIKEAIPEYLL